MPKTIEFDEFVQKLEGVENLINKGLRLVDSKSLSGYNRVKTSNILSEIFAEMGSFVVKEFPERLTFRNLIERGSHYWMPVECKTLGDYETALAGVFSRKYYDRELDYFYSEQHAYFTDKSLRSLFEIRKKHALAFSILKSFLDTSTSDGAIDEVLGIA